MLCAMWPSTAHAHLPECIGLSFVKNVDENLHTRVGVCLTGERAGEILVTTDVDSENFTFATTSVTETVHVFDNNPFGLQGGMACSLVIDPNNRTELHDFDIGLTTFGKKAVVVTFYVKDQISHEPARKKRTLIERAQMPSGTLLTPRQTMDALSNWLDDMNKKHAAKYGITQLAWSEQQASSRSSAGGLVRGWFRHDVADGCKRKVCPHASSAIEYMHDVCGTQFYVDMKQHGDKYYTAGK